MAGWNVYPGFSSSGTFSELNLKSIELEAVVKLAKGYRFQWEKSQNCFVLLFPEGMIKLNETAGDILKFCNNNSVAKGLKNLALEYEACGDEILKNDVLTFLNQARKDGWITLE